MDDKLASALIAAAVSLLGVVGAGWTSRWQITSKLRELEQTQLKDILAKRMTAYAELWSILQGQVSNRLIEEEDLDGEWASTLLADLNACHAKSGVFFSHGVYEAFCEVREEVYRMAKAYSPNKVVPADAVVKLDVLWSDGGDKPALAAQLKDDLGSFRPTMISLRNAD